MRSLSTKLSCKLDSLAMIKILKPVALRCTRFSLQHPHSPAGNKRHVECTLNSTHLPTPRLSHLTKRCAIPGSREDLWKAEPGQKTPKTWENVNVRAFLILCCILIRGFISLKKMSLKFCTEILTAIEKENLWAPFNSRTGFKGSSVTNRPWKNTRDHHLPQKCVKCKPCLTTSAKANPENGSTGMVL